MESDVEETEAERPEQRANCQECGDNWNAESLKRAREQRPSNQYETDERDVENEVIHTDEDIALLYLSSC